MRWFLSKCRALLRTLTRQLAQAFGRLHRFGQTRPVHVIRLVQKGTVEEKILAMHDAKAQASSSTDDDHGQEVTQAQASLGVEDIQRLLL